MLGCGYRAMLALQLVACLTLGRAAEIVSSSAPKCGALDADAAKDASQMIIEANAKVPPPVQIETRHAVLVVPLKPLEAGDVAADAFAGLPKVLTKAGKSVGDFTKFVVVSTTTKEDGSAGLIVGEDVCTGSGLVDPDAVAFMQSQVPEHLGFQAPAVLKCQRSECSTDAFETLQHQLPFLQALSGDKLKADVLPIVIQNQNLDIGGHLGDALAYLVNDGGLWEGESVLFVFGTDMSHGLPSDLAMDCDRKTAELLTTKSSAQVAAFFRDLKSGDAGDWCSSDNALPKSRASVLAARRVAELLNLQQSHKLVSNNARVRQAKEAALAASVAKAAAAGVPASDEAAAPAPPPLMPEDVRGFVSVLFWDNTMTVSERVGAMTPGGSTPMGFLQRHTA